MTRILFGSNEVSKVCRFPRPLQVESGELGKVASASRVALGALLVELNVKIPDPRLAHHRFDRPGEGC